jgi:calcineurin-like phosphoesterase family protein
MSNNKKAALIQHWNELGQDRPWRELAQMFDIKSTDGSISGELARCIVKNYRKKLKEQVEIEEVELQVEPKLKLKSRWSIGNKWGESYVAVKEGEVNPDDFRKQLIDEISKFSPKVKEFKFEKKNNPVALEISLPDLHVGKGDIDELEKNFFLSLYSLIEKTKGYEIEEIMLPVGNDLLNSEGITRATSKGTPQTDSVHWAESFTRAWKMLAKAVDYLSTIAPVKVYNVYGNHDVSRCYYAGDVLTAYFKDNKNVIVDNDYKPFKFYEYGNSAIMLNHGDNVKPSEYPLVFATEFPELFARCKYREVHLGHVHKERVDEYRGVKVRFLASICSNDEWHQFMGYSAMRNAQAFIWDKQTGLTGFVQHNIV